MLRNHRYYAEYNCVFDLANFPFDVQVCEMIFKLRTATKKYVEIRDGGLKYKGTKDLVEFEVSNITAMPGIKYFLNCFTNNTNLFSYFSLNITIDCI